MTIVDAVKKGFWTAKESLALVLVLFVFGVFWGLVNVFPLGNSIAMATSPSKLSILVGALFILVSFYVQAGSFGYVAEKIKTGKAELSQFFASGTKFYLPIFLLGILVALAVSVFVLVVALDIALLGARSAVASIVVAVIVGGLGIYFLMLLFFSPYLIVASGEKVLAAMGKSIALIRKNILSFLGLALVIVGIGVALGFLLEAISVLLARVSIADKTNQIIYVVLSSLMNSFLGVVVTGSFMSFYFAVSNENSNTNTPGA
jgi:hypothetical protein